MPSTPSTSHPTLEEQICQQIFALPPNCPRAKVHTVLDPLLEVDFSDTEDDIQRIFHDTVDERIEENPSAVLEYHSTTHDITPLMVACDKCNQGCLDYMLEKFLQVTKTKDPVRLRRAKTRKLRSLLGNPLMDASNENRNTAMHHAATAGCWTAIETLQRIQSLLIMHEDQPLGWEEGLEQHGAKSNAGVSSSTIQTTPSRTSILLRLGLARNSHNDTPLMMATQSSHAYQFVKTWYDLTWKELQAMNGGSSALTELVLREVLEATNDSKDSCLSLASSLGQIDLVYFLVGKDGEEGDSKDSTIATKVNVTANDVLKCKSSLHKMEQTLNSNPTLKKQYQRQCDNVKACLKLLESQLALTSDRVTKELLQEAELEKKTNGGSFSTDDKSKRKKKKKTKGKGDALISSGATSSVHAQQESAKPCDVQSEQKRESGAILTTLPDGKIAVRFMGHKEETPNGQPAIGIDQTFVSPDATDLLRERFKGISSEVDSVMSALCLDVKCLLYSDHGMALNLSPAQLDAVQQILEKQLESVQNAREIQHRMHEIGEQVK
ncbi:ankyrin repeat domain protein [Nitzschia inconspicua]|uniref:Ankyrin repeat domain protein n=1 Tax=Nitzschia inconspicua TaxID=303405 RepID=A0A9K3PPY3_9STRA|nr:ankyrin repeat domain protein [Nitzschia inconspicua]